MQHIPCDAFPGADVPVQDQQLQETTTSTVATKATKAVVMVTLFGYACLKIAFVIV
jgi:hypothetical protein